MCNSALCAVLVAAIALVLGRCQQQPPPCALCWQPPLPCCWQLLASCLPVPCVPLLVATGVLRTSALCTLLATAIALLMATISGLFASDSAVYTRRVRCLPCL